MNIHTKNTPSSLIAALLLALCASFAGCGTGAEGQLAESDSPSNVNGGLVNIASDAGNTAKAIDTTNIDMKAGSTAVAADTANAVDAKSNIGAHESRHIQKGNQADNLVLVADDLTKPWPCRRTEERFYAHQSAEAIQLMPLPAILEKCDDRIITVESLPYRMPRHDFRQPVLSDYKVVN